MKARAYLAVGAALAVSLLSAVALVQRPRDRGPTAIRVVATPVPTARISPVQTTAPTPTASPFEAPTPAPTPAVPDEKVRAAQRRLLELGYWLPVANGLKDANYTHAVTALEKVAALQRDGILDTAAKTALTSGVRPHARTTSGDAVEIDLARQVVMIVNDGRVRLVFDSSTGKAATPTRPGAFSVYKHVDGLRVSRLGRLWRPKYFDGGRAIHGYTSVPPYPASHGCVRVTYPAMDHVWSNDLMPLGTRVLVY